MVNGSKGTRSASSPTEMAQVVERNVQSLIDREHEKEEERTPEEKIADAITKFAGSMRFVYLHLLIFAFWIIVNLGWLPLPRFDPSFAVLALIASSEAIFLSAFILISQNRMSAMADTRANLDLQISLLAEHEVTQILKLVASIAEKVDADLGEVSELDKLAQDVHPEALMDTIETAANQTEAGNSSNHHH